MASSSYSLLSSSYQYDVFLSFRGEDVRKTFVDHLHSALLQQGIYTFKDDITLPRGESISPSLLKAIEKSKISVIIFSKNYADSSWCLDELVHIMKCRDANRQIVYPIFYHVDPSEVRNQKGEFGSGFAKQERMNITKAESWKRALVDSSKISGWELKHLANGHESIGIKQVVITISDKLSSLMPHDDEGLVGMRSRLDSLKSKLKMGSGGVLVVGIWGIGGSGKTTLASSLCMEISKHFDGYCLLDSICEESSKSGLRSLQEKILSKCLKEKVEVDSVDKGKRELKKRLCSKNVLLLLDDVDDSEQLDVLAGSHKWFGDGSRIIITTRDEHLLKAHKVDDVSPVSLLSQDESILLFKRHAFDEDKPVEDFEKLALRVVSYAAGLPLALKVLGSFLYGRDKNEWMSALDRLKDIPESKILDKLKISYEGLKPLEKELFLDIACFFRGEYIFEALPILDACGFYPGIGITVLRQKALITFSRGEHGDKFDMHDLVEEMGHYIVRGENPYNPEKHSRIWKTTEIDNMCLTKANDKIEALKYHGQSSQFCKLVSGMKKLRLLLVTNPWGKRKLLSNKLTYVNITGKIRNISNEERYGKIRKISNESRYVDTGSISNESRYTDTGSLSNESRYVDTGSLSNEARYDTGSLSYEARYVDISGDLSNELRYIGISGNISLRFGEDFPPAKLLVLKLDGNLQKEPWTGGKLLPHLKELRLCVMKNLLHTPDFGRLPSLKTLELRGLLKLEVIHPSLGNHTSLVHITICGCPNLRKFPAITRMEKLATLDFSTCRALGEFPEIRARMDSLVELFLDDVGIQVLPSSIGKYCTNLISMDVRDCKDLKSVEGNFHALIHLCKFKIENVTEQLKELPKDLFDENCCLEELSFRHRSGIPHVRLPRSLKKLYFVYCNLRDGQIPSDIVQLSYLQDLDLTLNDFSRFDFSLSQLTHLKRLILSHCKKLVELPELPSSIAILEAMYCYSLEVVGDSLTNCKWLSKVVLTDVRSVVDGDRLLEYMLQGEPIENHSMDLRLDGYEIPKLFNPPLVEGRRCRLQLAENWYKDFSGFLICGAVRCCNLYTLKISMKHEMGGSCGIDSQQADVVWEDNDSDNDSESGKNTWVVYVSFGSLKHTAWWDQTSRSTAVLFSMDLLRDGRSGFCEASGVRLVPRKMKSPIETADSSYSYEQRFNILHDSKYDLKIVFLEIL